MRITEGLDTPVTATIVLEVGIWSDDHRTMNAGQVQDLRISRHRHSNFTNVRAFAPQSPEFSRRASWQPLIEQYMHR